MEDNFTVLQAAFDRVADLEALYGDAIPYAAIREGFVWHGETLHFETKARGILSIFMPSRPPCIKPCGRVLLRQLSMI